MIWNKLADNEGCVRRIISEANDIKKLFGQQIYFDYKQREKSETV